MILSLQKRSVEENRDFLEVSWLSLKLMNIEDIRQVRFSMPSSYELKNDLIDFTPLPFRYFISFEKPMCFSLPMS